MTYEHSHDGGSGHTAKHDDRLQLLIKGICCECRDHEIRKAASIGGVQRQQQSETEAG